MENNNSNSNLKDNVVLFDGTCYSMCPLWEVQDVINEDPLQSTEIITSFDCVDEADEFVDKKNAEMYRF